MVSPVEITANFSTVRLAAMIKMSISEVNVLDSPPTRERPLCKRTSWCQSVYPVATIKSETSAEPSTCEGTDTEPLFWLSEQGDYILEVNDLKDLARSDAIGEGTD
jgi:hypothetical protein